MAILMEGYNLKNYKNSIIIRVRSQLFFFHQTVSNVPLTFPGLTVMIKKRTWKEFSIRSEGYFPNILKVNEKPTILTETLKKE